MDDLIEALQIFKKYMNTRNPTSCDHDVLYIMGVGHEVSEADQTRLKELGFNFNEDEEVWYSFRFGSA